MTPDYSKDISTVAYILPVGWVVAFALRKLGADDTKFTVFHLRQSFGLSIVELVCYFAIGKGVDNVAVNSLLTVVFAFLIYIGIRGVRNGFMRYQPFLGRRFEAWFAFIA